MMDVRANQSNGKFPVSRAMSMSSSVSSTAKKLQLEIQRTEKIQEFQEQVLSVRKKVKTSQIKLKHIKKQQEELTKLKGTSEWDEDVAKEIKTLKKERNNEELNLETLMQELMSTEELVNLRTETLNTVCNNQKLLVNEENEEEQHLEVPMDTEFDKQQRVREFVQTTTTANEFQANAKFGPHLPTKVFIDPFVDPLYNPFISEMENEGTATVNPPFSAPIPQRHITPNATTFTPSLERETFHPHQTTQHVTQQHLVTSNNDLVGQLTSALTNAFGNNRSSMDRDVPFFDGNPADWETFKSEFLRTSSKYKYENSENITRLRKILKGKALELVKHLLFSPNNLPKVWDSLQRQFGRPEFVLDYLVEKAKACKPPELNKPATIVEFGRNIEVLVTNICSYNEMDFMNSRQLVSEFVTKLPGPLKDKWFEYLEDNPFAKPTLKYFSVWFSKKVNIAMRALKPTIESEVNQRQWEDRRKPRRNTGEVYYNEDTQKEKSNVKCDNCGYAGHVINQCRKFLKLVNSEKWKLVKEKKLCFCCLKPGHRTENCSESKQCGMEGCNMTHTLLLHYTPRATTVNENNEKKGKDNPTTNVSTTPATAIDSIGLSVIRGSGGPLPILPVKVKGHHGTILTYAMLDSGASKSLISREIATKLGIKGHQIEFSCRGFGGSVVKEGNAERIEVELSGNYHGSKPYLLKDVITVSNIGKNPYSLDLEEAKRRWPQLQRMRGKTLVNVTPQIIIGSSHSHLIVPKEILCSSLDGPVAARTPLGWTLTGNLHENLTSPENMFFVGQECGLDNIMHELIKDAFRVENFGIQPSPSRDSKEDMMALQIMKSTTKRVGDHWESGLLWRNPNVVLPTAESMKQAFSRLLQIEKKMQRSPEFATSYKAKIEELLAKGYIRKLSKEEAAFETSRTFYVPHFGVTNPNKPGKLRLVMDAAAKSDGMSLNDAVFTGPDNLRPLPTVIWNFRRHIIGISGDIEDMFPRIAIRKEDRCSQRLLWRDGDTTRGSNVDVYQMEVLMFGVSSSPSTAIYVKDMNASDFIEKNPVAVEVITQDFYMDDCTSGADTIAEAIQLRKDVTEINSRGSFYVKKWLSNSKEVMESIPEDLRLAGKRNLDENKENSTERVLGLWWDPEEDIFTFNLNLHKVKPEVLDGRRPTKREVCSVVMSIYDQVGFIGHFKIKGMIILQSIWRTGIEWDDDVVDDIFEDWKIWLAELQFIKGVKIPRCYSARGCTADEIQLHVFVDASHEAYSAVCYFRIKHGSSVNAAFVSSKVKVASLKKLTIPRLELQAAVLGSKLAGTLMQEIKVKVSKCWFWSDSKTVLSWIRTETHRFQEFVANRVGFLQETTNIEDWRWIPTELNVADDATRLKTVTDLTPQSRWFCGPEFLSKSEENWPANERTIDGKNAHILIVSEEKLDGLPEKRSHNGTLPDLNRFSSYIKLVRASAMVEKAAQKWLSVTVLKNTVSASQIKIDITTEDERFAEEKLIRQAQHEAFGPFQSKSDDKRLKTKLSALFPFYDKRKILRSNSRIRKAEWLPEESKIPIILPSKHRFTYLLIDWEHRKNGHTGVNTVLNNLRSRFWIIDGRQAVRHVFSKCQICKLQRAKPVIPQMAALPNFRIAVGHPPFYYTGVDYFGPMEVTVGRRHEKRWGAIFCCLVTRAVHLEISHSLSTDEFMLTLSRFISARGRPNTIWSDNGTNFVGAVKELKDALSALDMSTIMKNAKFQGITQRFLPVAASHMAGAWERLIQAVKKVLKNILKERYPRDTTLLTLMKEAENIVNSRPMTYVSSDVSDAGALTPNHFLRGGADSGPTIPNSVDGNAEFMRSQWKRAQWLTDLFWKKWTSEYLPELIRRDKWREPADPIRIGDLVCVADEKVPRNQWIKAVVTATYPGDDGQVRSVDAESRDFETKKATRYNRPVTKICPMGLSVLKTDEDTSVLGVEMSNIQHGERLSHALKG